MKIMEIEGGKSLTGTIRISGAKNATVALIPAAILTDEEATICNIPEITYTEALCDILDELNVGVKRASESIIINPKDMKNIEITEEYSKKLTEEIGKKYSIRYLFDIRKLYLFAKVHPLGAQLTMSHYRLLFPLNDDNEINYYIEQITKRNLY